MPPLPSRQSCRHCLLDNHAAIALSVLLCHSPLLGFDELDFDMDKVCVLAAAGHSVFCGDKLNAEMATSRNIRAWVGGPEATVMFVVQTEVLNPAFDSVPATLVDLLVTDSGSVTPAYVYRLLQVSSHTMTAVVLCCFVR